MARGSEAAFRDRIHTVLVTRNSALVLDTCTVITMKIGLLKSNKAFLMNVLSAGLIALFALSSVGNGALAAATPSDDQVRVPDGGSRALTASDFAPHRELRGSYSEAWTYVFLLDGGMQAHFSISRANLGRLLGRVSGAEFAVTGFNGQSFRAPKQYGDERFIYTAARNRIEVSPRIYAEGAFTGQHKVYFEANKDESRYTLDLTMTDIAPGLTWGDGVFHLGSEKLGIYVHIPHARVSGSITVDGETKRVSGTAYMDHTYQTDFAPKLVKSAYRLVEHGANPTVGFFVVPAARYEERIVGFGASRQGGRFQLQKPQELNVVSTRTVSGARIPYQFTVRLEGRQSIFNRERDTQTFAVLEDLGGIAKTLASSYIGGEPVVVRGRGTTNAGRPFLYDILVIR